MRGQGWETDCCSVTEVVPRNPIPLMVLVVALFGIAAALVVFEHDVVPEEKEAQRVLDAPSRLQLGMTVSYKAGPLLEEDYTMSDVDGVSSSRYRALGRSGTQITVQERARETLDAANVAYFFQRAVQDGIWELTSKPPRGDTSATYRISVYQLTDGQQGTRDIAFTDPHYWATTGGHQFHIKLDPHKPVPDLLQLSSTTLVEPRYQELVDGFRDFGPPSFKAKVAQARARLGLRT